MAWIESHQSLANHPKTRRLARALDVSRVTAVGHLQFLWWWALDYAQDGVLTTYDATDIKDATDWEGDAEGLLAALIDCGFIEREGDEMRLHDWHDFAGKLIERRKADAERKRSHKPNPKDGGPTSNGAYKESAGTPQDIRRNSDGGRTESFVTVPNRTVPTERETSTTSDVDGSSIGVTAEEWAVIHGVLDAFSLEPNQKNMANIRAKMDRYPLLVPEFVELAGNCYNWHTTKHPRKTKFAWLAAFGNWLKNAAERPRLTVVNPIHPDLRVPTRQQSAEEIAAGRRENDRDLERARRKHGITLEEQLA